MLKRPSSLLTVAAVSAVLVPFFLHRRFRVANQTLIHRPPSEVFPFIADLQQWSLWAPWLPENGIETSAQTSGPGAWLRWETRLGSCALRATHVLADQRLAVAVDLSDDRELEGIVSLENLGRATRVTLVAIWPTSGNPWARYGDLALRLKLCRDFRTGLDWLRALVESKAQD